MPTWISIQILTLFFFFFCSPFPCSVVSWSQDFHHRACFTLMVLLQSLCPLKRHFPCKCASRHQNGRLSGSQRDLLFMRALWSLMKKVFKLVLRLETPTSIFTLRHINAHAVVPNAKILSQISQEYSFSVLHSFSGRK